MQDKKAGAVALERLALLVALAAAYEAITGGCLAALWLFARGIGGHWLLR